MVDAQCTQLAAQLDSVSVSQISPETRQQLLTAATKLVQRLETPWDFIVHIVYSDAAKAMATKVAIDMDLFRHLSEAAKPTASHAQIASLTGADSLLTKRIMRTLAANGVIDEVDEDSYAPNDVSTALLNPEAAGTVTYSVEVQLKSWLGVPAYIREHNFQNPSGPDDCPWNAAMATDLSFFEWLKAHPDHLKQFGGYMKGFNESRMPWTSFFPLQNLFDAGADTTSPDAAPFMVDIGGNMGHDLLQVLRKFPALSGRLVLQDRPEVVANAVVPAQDIQKMPHDIFVKQPVQGARMYFLHSILHDWPDFKAKEILLNIVPAMKRGYSKIVLLEHALPTRNPSAANTGVDLLMMLIAGAQERDERIWTDLLESAGLKLTKVWRSTVGGQAVLEIDLA